MIIEREACWQMKRRGKALPLRVGVDEEGDITVLDLASVHALLLTGPTGSGKSVAVHTLLAGLMGYLPPDKLQFVLIDGKGLEFVNRHTVLRIFPGTGLIVKVVGYTCITTCGRRYGT